MKMVKVQYLKDKGWEGVERTDLSQDRDSDGLLWTRKWTFGFHKMRGTSWLAKELFSNRTVSHVIS